MMVNLPFNLMGFNSGIQSPYHSKHTLFIALQNNTKIIITRKIHVN